MRRWIYILTYFTLLLLACIHYRGVVQDATAAAYDESEGREVDPQNGYAAMWLTVASQWICVLLYSVSSEGFPLMFYIYLQALD